MTECFSYTDAFKGPIANKRLEYLHINELLSNTLRKYFNLYNYIII